MSRTGRAEGPGGCLRRIGELGGGAKYFSFRAEMCTKIQNRAIRIERLKGRGEVALNTDSPVAHQGN